LHHLETTVLKPSETAEAGEFSMKAVKPIWETSFLVGFGAIDRSDRLTIAGAFEYFQDAAINHAEDLGIGREAMAETGQVWILSRMSALIERRPAYREPVTVRTWPCGWEKLFALREYDIRDAADRRIARGSACWLIFDAEKRRPLRPGPVMENFPRNDGMEKLAGGAASLEPVEPLRKAGERRALYSDIDYNGHVNNTRFIQWIQDVADPGVLENAGTIRLDINYLGEIKIGEVVGLWTGGIRDSLERPSREAGIAFEGRRPQDLRPLFRAALLTGGAGGTVWPPVVS
jgi:acyl-ACP thioesterase